MMPTTVPPRAEWQNEVDRLRRGALVCTRAEDIPAGVILGAGWPALLTRQVETGAPALPAAWSAFAEVLPLVSSFLRRCVLGVAVLVEASADASLLYAYRKAGALHLHQGRPPLPRNAVPERLAHVWPKLPAGLRDFHHGLHDGWTSLSSDATGLLPVHRLRFLSEDEWPGLSPEAERGLPLRLADVLALFGNGAGDYLCINTADADPRTSGLVWWHDDPTAPDIEHDAWSVMDEWTNLFVEDAAPVPPRRG
jgi:hypothetical protein